MTHISKVTKADLLQEIRNLKADLSASEAIVGAAFKAVTDNEKAWQEERHRAVEAERDRDFYKQKLARETGRANLHHNEYLAARGRVDALRKDLEGVERTNFHLLVAWAATLLVGVVTVAVMLGA